MSYTLNIAPYSTQSWADLLVETQYSFDKVLGYRNELKLRPVQVIDGKEHPLNVAERGNILNGPSLFDVYFNTDELGGVFNIIVCSGNVRENTYEQIGLSANIDIISGSPPITYVVSACCAVATATLCSAKVSDSSSIWVQNEWSTPEEFVRAIKLKERRSALKDDLIRIHETMAWNSRH